MDHPAPPPAPSSPPPPQPEPEPPLPPTRWQRFKRALLGGPKDIQDPHLFQHISLAAFLAWVGLGADGLSSSSYGPEEAFKALGEHQYLAVFLAALTALTVLIIAASYSKIIEHFPFGGGGYVVATKLLGPRWGVVSGSALLIDYVLTITTSIASGGDAIFSSLPDSLHSLKLPTEVAVIAALTVLNLRGVKESVTTLVPIFLAFVATHIVIIGGSVFFHLGRAHEVVGHVRRAGAVHARVLAGRGHVHRDRGRLQRAADHARAAGGDRQAHDAVHGRLARRDRGRDHPGLLADRRLPGAGADHERRAGHEAGGFLARGRAGDRQVVRGHHAALRGPAAVRRGADRVHRRPARDGQHGARLVAAAPLQRAQRSLDHAERRAADGRHLAGDAHLHPRLGVRPGGDVRHQRLRDLLPQPGRDGALLADGGHAPQAPRLGQPHLDPRRRPAHVRHHPGGV